MAKGRVAFGKRRRKRASARAGALVETLRLLLIIFVAAVILRSFIVAPFVIPSGSMLPRLLIGDYLFVAKWPYGYSRYALPFGLGTFDGKIWAGTPDRGDVAVFRSPGGTGEDYVKRVIGLPGDTVQMREGRLILNGRPVPQVRVADFVMEVSPNSACRTVDVDAARRVSTAEGVPACAYARYRETMPDGRSYHILDQIDGPADDTPPITVPAGHYFVLGDNRDDSMDSRFPASLGGVGLLPQDHLVGEALITFFSTDGSAEWVKPWTWFSAARWGRIGETF